ncbi:MAG: ATP-grasp domain-containing protein [Treponema sp.]|nr:ATP-grasp domain-containing protein [Treponema sp.]
MKIVFYSTNSNIFDEETFKIKVLPQNTVTFQNFCQAHSEHNFFCVTQKPAIFLPEEKLDNQIIYLPKDADTKTFADRVASLNPDLAIAMTFWIEPYDWLPMSDALVAEELRERSIRTICHSVQTGLICFDKWRTHNEFTRLGFQVAPAIFCDHDLYFCAGSNREVLRNIYKESVLTQIRGLRLPVIIKDTTGLSSYGMTVAHTYGEVTGYLNSKRNNSNRLIEEFISGRQFGLEIYGLPGAYTVLPPFEFSVNQYGITSPKQSVKYGPCQLPEDLQEMMLKLAEGLKLCGVAQVDLILDDEGHWHIIEINPRLSGMTFTYAVACGLSVFEMIYRTVIEPENTVIEPVEISTNMKKHVLSLKLPLMSDSMMAELLQQPGVKLLNQTNDLAAKQEREKGFCECIIAADEKSVLQEVVARFEELFPGDAIILQAKKIVHESN